METDAVAVPRSERSARFAVSQEVVEVMEGATRLLVPRHRSHAKGPAAVEGEIFYNPAMRFARDVSVLAAEGLARERAARWGAKAHPVRVFDGLAASGARGVRMAHEVGNVHVTLNDRSEESVATIRRNLAANGVAPDRAVVLHGDFRKNLAGEGYDYVDVDPYGSPAPFLDAACLSLADKGILGVSATDATALAGVYPKVARRRYFGVTLRSMVGHEIAVRVLLGAVARTAARLDKGVEPALVHATDHYYRVYARLRRGANRADAALDRMGYAYYTPGGGPRGVFLESELRATLRDLPDKVQVAGPLWTGPLFDGAFLERVAEARAGRTLAMPREVDKHLALWEEEADAPPLFFDVDELAHALKGGPPRTPQILVALREAGFVATRTHVQEKAIKTNASWSEALDVLRPMV